MVWLAEMSQLVLEVQHKTKFSVIPIYIIIEKLFPGCVLLIFAEPKSIPLLRCDYIYNMSAVGYARRIV